jgi:hypothetical protein
MSSGHHSCPVRPRELLPAALCMRDRPVKQYIRVNRQLLTFYEYGADLRLRRARGAVGRLV